MSFGTRSVPLDSITEVYLEAVQGDDETYYMTAEVLNPSTEAFEILDLNLASNIEFSIKNGITQTIEYTTDENTGNITITDAAGGKFTVEIPNASSSNLTVGELRYDVQVTFASGSKKRTILRGPIQIVDDITP